MGNSISVKVVYQSGMIGVYRIPTDMTVVQFELMVRRRNNKIVGLEFLGVDNGKKV